MAGRARFAPEEEPPSLEERLLDNPLRLKGADLARLQHHVQRGGLPSERLNGERMLGMMLVTAVALVLDVLRGGAAAATMRVLTSITSCQPTRRSARSDASS